MHYVTSAIGVIMVALFFQMLIGFIQYAGTH